MTTHNPFISYPKHEHWRRYCKNGQPANGTLARRLVDGTNHVVAYRRKLFGTKCVAISAVPAGASSATEHWHFAGHTGVGVAYLEASIILAKADNGTDPFVYMQAVPIAGGSTLTSNEFHYSVVDASADDYPDEFAYGTIRVAVDPDTLYRVALITSGYARPVACSVYEIGEVPVNTSNGAVDPRVHTGVNILDSQIEELMPAQTAIWRNNAGPVLQWCRDSVGTAPTRSTASYANLINQSAGSTVDANSIGVRVNLQYHNTQAQADVPVLMVVRAQRTAGSTNTNNAVKVTDGTNEIEIAGIDDSTLWYTVVGTMPATDGQKWDIQLRANSVSETVRVDAVYVFEWQATPRTLLERIAEAGLGTPTGAFDYSEVASGSFANHGSASAVTCDPGGTPLYEQAFPAPVGGLAVGFDDVATDYFEMSDASLGDSTTGPIAIFVVMAASANTGTVDICDKRDAGPGPGWELRTTNNVYYNASIEDDDNDSAEVTTQADGSVMDGAAHYLAYRLDPSGDTLYAWHDGSASERSSAIPGTNTTFTSARAVRIGKGLRNAFGNGGGMVRYLIIWEGAAALDLDKAAADALWAELQS